MNINNNNEKTNNFKDKINNIDNSIYNSNLNNEIIKVYKIKKDSISDKSKIYPYKLKNLEKLNFKDILKYYDYNPEAGYNLADIYY